MLGPAPVISIVSIVPTFQIMLGEPSFVGRVIVDNRFLQSME